MVNGVQKRNHSLIVGIQTYICAVPLTHVIETMRPLPVEPIKGPPFVRGISLIRGITTPIVDLGMLLGFPNGAVGRFVTLRLEKRQVALTVGGVLGIRELDESMIHGLPPLLQETSNEIIEAMGTLDAQLLIILRAGWKLPDEVWQSLATRETTQ